MHGFLWTSTISGVLFSLWSSLFWIPGISNAEARQPGKAPNFSVNWTVGDQALEVINATTGKDDMGRASRLCKNALYSRWVRLHSKVAGPAFNFTGSLSSHVVVESIMFVFFVTFSPFQLSSILWIKMLKPSSYHEAKQAATEYHSAKQALIKAFHKAGLGAWVKKPIEQDQFTLSSWGSKGPRDS